METGRVGLYRNRSFVTLALGERGYAPSVAVPTLRAVAGVLIQDAEQRIMLVQRTDDSTWGLPGGGVEPGESWRQAAESECLEETGCRVLTSTLLGVYSNPATQSHTYPDGRAVHFVGVVFRASVIEDDFLTECRGG